MVKGDVIFCATGITDGDILKALMIKVRTSKLIHLYFIKVRIFLKKLKI